MRVLGAYILSSRTPPPRRIVSAGLRNKARCRFGITCSGIFRPQWMRIHRPRAFDDPGFRTRCKQLLGSASLFYPVFERCKRIEFDKSRPAAAVMDSGDQKQPEEVVRLRSAAQLLDDRLVVAD